MNTPDIIALNTQKNSIFRKIMYFQSWLDHNLIQLNLLNLPPEVTDTKDAVFLKESARF